MTDLDQSRTDSDVEKDLSDDSDVDIDPVEFETRMATNLRKIILAETQFQKVKLIIRNIKIEQLRKRKEDALNGSLSDLLDRNAEAYDDFNEKNKMADIVLGLEQDSLDRKTSGLRIIVLDNQSDNEIMDKCQLINELEQEIELAKSEVLSSRIVLEHIFREPDLNGFKRKHPLMDYRSLELKRRELSHPLIVHQLTEKEIEDDLRTAEFAILVSEMSDLSQTTDDEEY